MRPRDALIVAAVLLLGGVALADSLRGRGASTQPATTSGTTTEREDRSRPEQFPGLQVGGSLVFTTARDCLVREVDVSTGLEFPVPPIRTACDLWAPARTERVAVSTGSRSGEALPFRFVDLNHPDRDVGASRARFGVVLWSPDGQWAAWCDVDGGGFLVELGGARRRIARCPRAVTDDGEPAYVAGPAGNVVEAGGRRLLAASGFVAELHPGVDGSFGVLAEGVRLERWVAGRRTALVSLREDAAGRTTMFAPDNCAALVLLGGARIRLVPLPCFGPPGFTNVAPDNCLNRLRDVIDRCAQFGSPRTFEGTDAAWSPDGDWIAVVEDGAIAFHRVKGRYEEKRWATDARALAWLG